MELNGFLQVFFGGMLGPLLMELVKIAGWRDAEKVRNRYKEPLYLVSTAVLFILAGVVVVLNGVAHVPVLHAIELGIGAPAIISGYATASASRNPPGAGFIGGIKPEMPGNETSQGKVKRLLAW